MTQMRYIRVMVAAAMVLASPAAADSWVKFTDPEGHFTVKFPFAPQIERSKNKTDDGATVSIVQYEANEYRVSMMEMVSDFSGQNIDAQGGLDIVIAKLSTSPDYILENSQNDALDGHVGRYFSMIEKSSGIRLTDRIFFFDNHLYQTMTGTIPNARPGDIADAKRFRESLHFLSLTSSLAPAPEHASVDTVSAVLAANPSTAEAQCQAASPDGSDLREIASPGGAPASAPSAHTFRELLIGDRAEMDACRIANAFAAAAALQH